LTKQFELHLVLQNWTFLQLHCAGSVLDQRDWSTDLVTVHATRVFTYSGSILWRPAG